MFPAKLLKMEDSNKHLNSTNSSDPGVSTSASLIREYGGLKNLSRTRSALGYIPIKIVIRPVPTEAPFEMETASSIALCKGVSFLNPDLNSAISGRSLASSLIV